MTQQKQGGYLRENAMSRRQEVFVLRAAYLAFCLLRMLKTDGEIYPKLVIERAGRDELLKLYGPSEWEEATGILLAYRPEPLARGVRPGLIAITDYGRERSSADVLSELVQQQYQASKRPVEVASNWQFLADMASWMLVGGIVLFIAIQPIYVPSGTVLPTLDPWPAKLAAVLSALSFILLVASAGNRAEHWFSNEQLVASAFYESYLHYRNFIKNPQDAASLKQARKLVRKATMRMQQVGKPRWEILGEELERVSGIGKNVDERLVPAMGDHAESLKIGELVITLAGCFLQKTRDSMRMALAESSQVKPVPTELQAPTRWPPLSHYLGRSHPKTTGCVTGLVIAACVLTVYVAIAYGSHEPIVPGAAVFAGATASGLTGGLGTFLALDLRRSG